MARTIEDLLAEVRSQSLAQTVTKEQPRTLEGLLTEVRSQSEQPTGAIQQQFQPRTKQDFLSDQGVEFLLKNSPELAQRIANTKKPARRDLQGLGVQFNAKERAELSSKLRGESSPGGFFKGLVEGFKSGLLNVRSGLTGTLAEILKPAKKLDVSSPFSVASSQVTMNSEDLKRLNEGLNNLANELIERGEEFALKEGAGIRNFVGHSIGQAVPFMAASTAAALLTGSPAGAFAISFAVEGDNAFRDAIRGGATEEQANTERIVVGSLNGAIEQLQVGGIFKFAKKARKPAQALIKAAKDKALKKIAKAGGKLSLKILKNATQEGLQEAIQENVSLFAPALTGRDLPSFEEFKSRTAQAFIGGAVVGGAFGAAGAVLSRQAPAEIPERATREQVAEDVVTAEDVEVEPTPAVEPETEQVPVEAPTEEVAPQATTEAVEGEVEVVPVAEKPVTVKETAKQPETTVIPETPQIRKDVSDAVEFNPEKPTTSARKAQVNEDRESLGLKEINSTTRRGWNQALKQAKKENIPTRATAIADEINVSPRALSDIETAGLTMKMAELKNTHKTLSQAIERSKDSAEIESLASQLERVEGEFDSLSQAVLVSGTEKGRALASQKLTLDEDLSLVSVLTRAKANKRADLTPQERAKFTETISKLEQRVTALEESRAKESGIIANMQLRRGVKRFTTLTRTQRQTSSSKLASEVKSLLEQGCQN